MTPFDLTWPRTTSRTVLRLLTMDDVAAMHSYRSLPEVCRFLTHDVLTREEVARRITSRLPEDQPTHGPLTCGVAIVVDGRMVGDAMLRMDEGGRLWIGYGLHPSVWGRGVATEVATELVAIGRSLGLSVWADSFADNVASQVVLERAGFALDHEAATAEGLMRVFTDTAS